MPVAVQALADDGESGDDPDQDHEWDGHGERRRDLSHDRPTRQRVAESAGRPVVTDQVERLVTEEPPDQAERDPRD